MATYVNDLRLKEIATGDESGTWGTSTNTNLELIAEAFSYGTEASFGSDADATTTIADGLTDPARSLYFKVTSGVSLTATRTLTLAPNDVSKIWIIENATSGSQSINISQGSGANVTIPNGSVAVVYSDGAGAGAAVVDAFASLNVGALTVSGDIDVDGTTNLDNTDIDGTLDVSGQVTFADGSASAPSISNTGDVNAGLFFSAADVMSFSAGGTAQFTMADGSISPVTDNDIDLGTASLKYKSFFAGLVDAENFKINGGQGSDGQVLTSTGSGVAWEDGGGGGGVTFKEQGTNFTNSLMVGDDATGTLSSATGNTALGIDVFAALTSGINNVAVGYAAMTAITSAYSNVAVGANALDSLTAGHTSVAVGHNALAGVTTAAYNIGIGTNAGVALTTGAGNTVVGANSLNVGTTAVNNVVLGGYSATSITDGIGNTITGTVSAIALTTGDYNNTLGYGAGYAITTGNENICIGSSAGLHLTTGSNNVAIGGNALNGATTVSNQTAVGHFALQSLTSGEANTSVGYIALKLNTTGSYNAALGQNALGSNTTANGNTGLGYSAGYAVTTGAGNTFVGASSGTSPLITTGANNTFVGGAASGTAADTLNANALGYGVKSETGYTTVGLDASDIRAANGTATWATVSDERVKKDIEDSTAGLSFINELRPRTFNFKAKGDLPKEFNGYEEGSTEAYKNSKTQHGFIAQEVKAVIDNHTDIADGFKLWDVRGTGQQEVAEAALIPMLVKAIQELSAEVEKLKGE